MSINSKKIIEALTSLRLTVFCMALSMVLVFLGTMAQAEMGTFAAQRKFFNHFLVFGPQIAGIKIPVFPGGLAVGLLWFINLAAMLTFRMRYHKKNVGILLVHVGLITMLLGQFFTQIFGHESRLVFNEGETKNFIESSQTLELAIIRTDDQTRDQIISIPPHFFDEPGFIETPLLPFKIEVLQYFPNSTIRMKKPGETSLVSEGVGTQLMVDPLPVTTKDDEINNVTILFNTISDQHTKGPWMASLDLGAPQTLTIADQTFQIFLRFKRQYLPYSLTLKDFKHDRYPGTNIPKNFSSLVTIHHPEKGEERPALIYMNNPLRYEGLTFYQASFANEDTTSILQVVDNKAWLTPYLSCILVTIGLGYQFFSRLSNFNRRKQNVA